MPQKKGPLALIIIDGWGHSPSREGNAIALASKPFYDELSKRYPQTLLSAHGTRVGLPDGVMGNSEVGHLNLGAGRVIRMDVSRIDHDTASGDFFRNEVLANAMDGAKERGKQLHLMGLISDGQVHSSQEHLYALLRMAKQRGVERVFVHCFLDGRDTPPSSAADYVAALQEKIQGIGCGQIATVVGRYYAMDRDRRWERSQRAYDLLVNAVGERANDPVEAIKESYQRGVTDEFVEPIVIVDESGEPVAPIQAGDAVIFFNFRPDRARQITRVLTIAGFDEFPIPNRPAIDFVCFSVYDVTFPLAVAFPPRKHENILADVFARFSVENFRLAETEKYAHVTYFFNGGTEKEFRCEQPLLVPSPKIATYDLEPAMSAFKITNNLLRFIDEDSRGIKLREGGALEDVALTMLGLLGIEKPAEMTGRDLRTL